MRRAYHFLTRAFQDATSAPYVRVSCFVLITLVFLVSSYGLMGWAAYRLFRWLF